MPTFKSEGELKAAMMKGAKTAVAEAQLTMYITMKKYLTKFYGEYHPKVSIRTMQLFGSLQKSGIIPTGNGFKAEVYFDLGMMHHLDSYVGQGGFPVRKHWSEGKIMSVALTEGTHGGRAPGTAIYTEGVAELDGKMFGELLKELIAAGLPIVG